MKAGILKRACIGGVAALSILAGGEYLGNTDSRVEACSVVDCALSTDWLTMMGTFKFSAPQSMQGAYADADDGTYTAPETISITKQTAVTAPSVTGCVDLLDHPSAVTFSGGTWSNGTSVYQTTCGSAGGGTPGGCI